MTTELDAINHILRTVGLGLRLATSTVNLHPQALSAQALLAEVSKDIQAKGQWFNTITLTLSPDASTGEVRLPQDTLSVDPTDVYSVLVQRGTKLYNPKTNDFNIGVSVECTIVQELHIDIIPHTAASLIKHTAALQHYENKSNDGTKRRALTDRKLEALILFDNEVLQQADSNAFETPSANRFGRPSSSNQSAIHNTLGV